MGYQALLFCPDEKTARTVTQVLGELEFNVEACAEPFAAVKKLMGQHFDAVVVDCDNEQNATLLFKSARNSTSNQGSLAVAVVEGQAGVAKAFRIGANLVLTKPINIEQAKGTLRVARGLLRKGEPAKPGSATTAPTSAASSVASPAAGPAVPVAGKSAPAVKPEVPASLPAISTTSRPQPLASSAPPGLMAARSTASAHDDDLLEIGEENSLRSNSAAPAPAPVNNFITPSPSADKFLAAAVPPEKKTLANAAWPANLGSGAASAPAPARERQETRVAFPEPSIEKITSSKTAEAVEIEASSSVGTAPTFTFGGSNVPAESSGSKKVFIGIAAAVIFLAAGYFGWTHLHGSTSQPEKIDTETAPTSVPVQQSRKPSGAQHPSLSAESKPSASLPSEAAALSVKDHASGPTDSASSDETSSAPSSAKLSSPTNKPANEAAKDSPETDVQPLMVKAGKSPAAHAKPGTVDAPAPSMIGIATTGGTAPPPDLGTSEQVAPKPLLQTLNISQGVSRGLLYKKVQPVYPRNALSLRLEGSVELMATVSKTGDITRVKVLSGESQLSKAATEAVKQWKYKPYLLNGEPVEIQTQVTINFKLPK